MSWTRTAGVLGLVVFLAVPAVGQPAEDTVKSLTLDRLYSLPNLIGTAPTGLTWSADGSKLAFLWNDEGGNFRDVWVLDVTEADSSPQRWSSLPLPEEQLPGPKADPVETARSEEALERAPGATAITWHPDGERILATFEGDLWLLSKSSEPERVSSTPGREHSARYSPDGDTLAFLARGELWTKGLAEPSLAYQRTELAMPDVRVTDFEWSPEGNHLALRIADTSGVPMRSIPDYLEDEPILRRLRRAYPGDEPVRHEIGVLGIGESRPDVPHVSWLDLGATPPDMLLSYAWSPDGAALAIDTSDLYAKDRRIFVADIGDGSISKARQVAVDADLENETFYFWRIAWSEDSTKLYFLSDRRGDFHVWTVDPSENPSQPRQLTNGAWAVAEMHPVSGGLVAVGNLGNAEERHLFFVADIGGAPVRLSKRSGTHSPVVSPRGRHAAVLFSSDATPPDLYLTNIVTRVSKGVERAERRLTHSPISEFDDFHWVTPKYVRFESHIDGTELHGRLTLPPDFDPDRKYPAILGSVYTDSVRNQWGGRTAHPTWGLDQFLAQEGYVLLNVDMRGSWGRGREHRRGIRLDYGGMDIEDLESGVQFLGGLGFVDLERVGIWGSSYGGLMTAMSLFRKPGLYAAGVPGAPATNVWHALTGQMAVMMRPEDQPDEYRDSSPFLHADGLEGHLMIIHGMRDWVVLYKDSVTLVDRLIRLDKDVDLVTLPDAGHGWDNEGLAQTRYAFKKLVQHFERHLQPASGD